MAAVCNLHRRGVVVAVDDNDLDAEALLPPAEEGEEGQ